jgi:hypothetical protein
MAIVGIAICQRPRAALSLRLGFSPPQEYFASIGITIFEVFGQSEVGREAGSRRKREGRRECGCQRTCLDMGEHTYPCLPSLPRSLPPSLPPCRPRG